MIVVTCSCGKTYSLKPELAGRMVKCRRCGARLQIPRGAKRDVRGSAGETASIPEPPDEMQVTTERNTSGHTPGPSVAGPRASSGEYGSYTIVRPIGRGGMGQVSVARDEPLEREVALKQLLEEAAENPKRCRRFVEEAEITGQLEHPGVVPVYALGIDRHNRPYYAMRYVQGKTLHQAIHEHHAAPSTATLRGLLRHVTMVCHTMAYAHARGIIHRDLKPSNIIVGEFGETLILDWGLARPVEDRGAPSSTMGDLADRRLAGRGEVTTPGGPAGTPQYMSPEQAMGKSDELGPATDIYSLGAILYQILTGRPAYQGTSSSAVLQQVKAGPPQTPSMVRAGVPRPLEAICLKAMARQPNDRYPSSATLGKDLDRWLDDEPVTAYREPVREWAVRWARRHKAAAGTLFLAFVSIVIGSATMAVMVTRERARTTAATFLAEQYDRQAADAIELAQEKDEQADRLTREAAEARSQAEAAARQATESSAAAEQAKSRIAQLESDLKTQTQDTEALTRQLEQIRAELAALEARAAAETERALAAEKKAIALEREASDLRAAARDLRRLAADLTELALRASGQGTSTPPATTSIPELTEDDAATFDVTGVDGSGCQLVSDSSRVVFGRQSLLVRSGSAKQVRVAYPHRRNARWDLSTRDHLWLAVSVVDEDVVFQQGSPRIRLGRGSRYVEYQAPAGCLAENRATWTLFKIPLAGDANWQRTDVNGLDFSRVDWLEIHMASDKAGLLLWLDDIQFGPAQDQPPKAVAPFDAAQARKHQEAWAKYLNVPVEMINSLGMKFVLIPPGEFDMGFPQPEVDELLGEMRQSGNRSFVDHLAKGFLQQHRVRLTRALWLGTSEVTVGQFRKFVSETGYVTEGERDGKGGHGRDASGQWGIFPEFTWRHPGFVQSDDHPVVQVSWNDAAAFCEWLGRKEGKTYRLPTGAECEYACRAGSTTRWSFGDEQSDLGNYSWWSGNSEGHTHAVCQKIANAWGFYDMHGNVWEWCMDWYGVYPSGAVTDPQGPAIGSGRVARGGGSWNHDAANCRSAGCYAIVPTSRASYLGFRLALSPSGVRPEAAEDK